MSVMASLASVRIRRADRPAQRAAVAAAGLSPTTLDLWRAAAQLRRQADALAEATAAR